MRIIAVLLIGPVVLASACADNSPGSDVADASDVRDDGDAEDAAQDEMASDDAAVDEGVAEDAEPDDDGTDESGDTDPDAEAEAEGDGSMTTCAGGWYDSSSDLCWQDPAPYSEFDWNAAMAYCAALDLGGYGPGSWHLPTISELRSLVRGCPATETGGPCGVIDACLGPTCENDSCLGCASLGGPGAVGEYWPSALRGTAHLCWSSSSVAAGGAAYAGLVYFANGYVVNYVKTTTLNVRCVRPGP